MRELGLNAKSVPDRGGTDGARLSFMGPSHVQNLCTGGANYHGRFEYACIEQMELCVEILKKIVEKYAVKRNLIFRNLYSETRTTEKQKD